MLCFFFTICFFPEVKMNQEKLAKLQAQVRIGGKVWLILAATTHILYIYINQKSHTTLDKLKIQCPLLGNSTQEEEGCP